MDKICRIKDIPSLLGREFEVDPFQEIAFDQNHYTYKIAAYMGVQVLITWTSEYGFQEKTTYTKGEVVEHINNGVWILKN